MADLLKVPAIFVKVVTDIVDGEKPTTEEFLQNLATVTAALDQAVPQVVDFIHGKCLSMRCRHQDHGSPSLLPSLVYVNCQKDRELKGQLLRKYSGYLGSPKQEFRSCLRKPGNGCWTGGVGITNGLTCQSRKSLPLLS